MKIYENKTILFSHPKKKICEDFCNNFHGFIKIFKQIDIFERDGECKKTKKKRKLKKHEILKRGITLHKLLDAYKKMVGAPQHSRFIYAYILSLVGYELIFEDKSFNSSADNQKSTFLKFNFNYLKKMNNYIPKQMRKHIKVQSKKFDSFEKIDAFKFKEINENFLHVESINDSKHKATKYPASKYYFLSTENTPKIHIFYKVISQHF
jgi:hypothetical protein